MKLKINPIVFIAILFSVMGCSSSKPTGNTSPVINKSVSADCNTAIVNFNSFASGNIKNEIATINTMRNGLPKDLKELYPKARDAWNYELRNIKSTYSKNYTASSLLPPTIQSYSNWKSESMEDYQKFFLLLAEYSYGKYPSGSKDTLKKAGWIEKSDCKKRMESMVKYGLISRCGNSIEEVRELIDPILLPEKIEDCLLTK